MTERTIMDRAGDLWTVEDAWTGGERGTRTVRCRHELGYELVVTVAAAGAVDDAALVEALERVRRSTPRTRLAEAA